MKAKLLPVILCSLLAVACGRDGNQSQSSSKAAAIVAAANSLQGSWAGSCSVSTKTRDYWNFNLSKNTATKTRVLFNDAACSQINNYAMPTSTNHTIQVGGAINEGTALRIVDSNQSYNDYAFTIASTKLTMQRVVSDYQGRTMATGSPAYFLRQ